MQRRVEGYGRGGVGTAREGGERWDGEVVVARGGQGLGESPGGGTREGICFSETAPALAQVFVFVCLYAKRKCIYICRGKGG